MKKRLFSIFLAFVLLMTSANVLSADASTNEGITRDTVLVLDVSGSMLGIPITKLKEAAKLFCDSILKESGTNRVAIVKFSNSTSTLNFTSEKDNLISFIDSINAEGGTNMASAINAAESLLKKSTATIKNIVIMADGLPNSGTTLYNGRYSLSDGVEFAYANAVYSICETLHLNYNIYSLGFFHNINGNNLNFPRKFMKDIQNAGFWEVNNVEDLEFAFGNIAEEAKYDFDYIAEHIIFFDYDLYKAIKENNGFAGLARDYIKKSLVDEANTVWEVITNVGKWINFDFSNANDYDFILAQLLSNNDTYTMLADNFNDKLLNEINENLLMIADTMKLPNEYIKALREVSKNAKHFSDLTKNEIIEELNTHLNVSEVLSAYADLYDFGNKTYNNIYDIIKYVSACKAYEKTSDEFRAVLNKACIVNLAYENNYYIDGNDKEGKALFKAINDFILELDSYKKNSAQAIGEKFIESGTDTLLDLGTFVANEIADKNIYVKAISEAWNLGVDLANQLTDNDKLTYSTRMTIKLGYFASLMNDVLTDYENQLKNDPIMENAKLFDQAYRIYKNIQLFSYDVNIEYETILSNKWINGKEHLKTSFELMTSRNNLRACYCHVEQGNINGATQIIKINCPVDVYIYDMNGNEQGKIVKNVVTQLNKNVRLTLNNDIKEIHILGKDDYDVKLIGNDNGLFSYTSIFYDGANETKRIVFYDIPIQLGQEYKSNITHDGNQEDYFLNSEGAKYLPGVFLNKSSAPIVNITAIPSRGGYVRGSGSYLQGDSVLLNANPIEGYFFDGWYENGRKIGGNSQSYNFVANKDRNISASFKKTSDEFSFLGDIIFIAEETTVSNFINQYPDQHIFVFGNNNEELSVDTLIGTGAIAYIKNADGGYFNYLIIYIGDIDSDGQITAADARHTLRNSASLEEFSEIQKHAANVDFDELIIARNARRILRASANLENPKDWLKR